MGTTYSVRTRVKFKDATSPIGVLQKQLHSESTDLGTLMDSLVALDNQPRGKSSKTKRSFEADNWFDASYGWEDLMYTTFKDMAPYMEDGSYLSVWPDAEPWKLTIQHGSVVESNPDRSNESNMTHRNESKAEDPGQVHTNPVRNEKYRRRAEALGVLPFFQELWDKCKSLPGATDSDRDIIDALDCMYNREFGVFIVIMDCDPDDQRKLANGIIKAAESLGCRDEGETELNDTYVYVVLRLPKKVYDTIQANFDKGWEHFNKRGENMKSNNYYISRFSKGESRCRLRERRCHERSMDIEDLCYEYNSQTDYSFENYYTFDMLVEEIAVLIGSSKNNYILLHNIVAQATSDAERGAGIMSGYVLYHIDDSGIIAVDEYHAMEEMESKLGSDASERRRR